MNCRQVLFRLFVGFSMLSLAADAGYIFVLPPPGAANPTLQGFSEQFISMGAPVPVPSDTFQVVTNLNASKAILISANTTAPVSFLNIQNGQMVGPVRSLNLEDKQARAAALSPDGSKLLVLAGANPGVLFVIDLNTETLALAGRIQVPLDPRDLVVSADSRRAFVLSIGTPNTLSVVDLATSAVASQQAVARVSGGMAISLAPTGAVYVTSQYALIEYNPMPPYLERARSALVTQPGKLYFSPDGRHALAKNLLGNGSSVVTLDLNTKNADYPAGIQVSSAPITTPGSNIPLAVDELIPISNALAIAYVASVPKMYLVQYPALSVSELNLYGIGSPSSVSGIAMSNEFPAAKSLYYNNAGNMSRHDVITNTQIGVKAATPGPLTFVAAASTATVTDVVGYGAGQIVAPSAQLRPYFVRVADIQGRPVYNAQVNFFADTAGVTLSAPLASTNMFGYAQVTASAPSVNGEFAVRAVSGSTAVVLKSTVTGGSGPAPSSPRLLRVSGDGQLRRWFDGFTDPLVVRVEDSSGRPIVGKQVIWTEYGGANFSGPTITTTDANGTARTTVIPAGTFTPGIAFLQYKITANTDIGNTVFTMTAFPTTCGVFCPPPQIELKDPQQDNRSLTLKLGTVNKDAIRALVYSGGGNSSNPTPIPGVALNVSTPFTDPNLGIVAACEGGTPLSGADGYVSCNLIATGPIGSTLTNVDVGNAISFSNITLNVAPGDPIAPVIMQGNNQTGKPGGLLPSPLSISITDAFGNALSGVPVTWTVAPAAAATLLSAAPHSDINGNASAQFLLGSTPGVFQVRVAAGGKESVFTFTVEGAAPAVTIALSRTSLVFAANGSGSGITSPQDVILTVAGGTNNWTAISNRAWLGVSPASGTGSTKFSVSIVPSALPGLGTYVGAVTVNATGATNGPLTLTCTLTVKSATTVPFGVFETPVNNLTGISGSIAVTGWALDDLGVKKLTIWRDPIGAEPRYPNGYVYIGDSLFVPGARPDVEAQFSTYPNANRAGWGYMMLTNALPGNGNGTFKLHAIAVDEEGNQTELGSKTITVDNAHSIKPFGALDNPQPGQTISGTMTNDGWALTPQPALIAVDGSMIWVNVDGVNIGHPAYGLFRGDVASLFPGYNNSNGSLGQFSLNSTNYLNGMHSIAWIVYDNLGHNDGIGSRFFNIVNGVVGASAGTGPVLAAETATDPAAERSLQLRAVRMQRPALAPAAYPAFRRGYDLDAVPAPVRQGGEGLLAPVEIPELDHLEIHLAPGQAWTAGLRVGEELRELPIGSTFDAESGIFYWQLGPGFLGEFTLEFRGADGAVVSVPVRVGAPTAPTAIQ